MGSLVNSEDTDGMLRNAASGSAMFAEINTIFRD